MHTTEATTPGVREEAGWLSVFLLGTYNSASRAVPEMDAAIEAGRRCVVFTFHDRLHDFLLPLREFGVEIVRLPTAVRLGLFRPWQWWAGRRMIREWERRHFREIRGARVHFYSTGYHLGYLGAIGCLTPSNEMIHENLEVDHATGVYRDFCTAWMPRAMGAVASWVVGVPVRYCRKKSPIPVLKDSFFSRYKLRRIERDGFVRPATRQNRCQSALFQASDARVLWVYDEDLSFSKDLKADVGAFRGLWQAMGKRLAPYAGPGEQFVKYHPAMAEGRPGVFPGVSTGFTQVPLEFFRFPHLRLVVGTSSYALHHFLDLQGVVVVSVLSLVAMDDALRAYYENMLATWVDPEGKMVRVKSLDEFESLCRRVLIS